VNRLPEYSLQVERLIDSSGERLPLSENQVAHLLVFTNFPVERKIEKADSLDARYGEYELTL
jgi:hypothetical protein